MYLLDRTHEIVSWISCLQCVVVSFLCFRLAGWADGPYFVVLFVFVPTRNHNAAMHFLLLSEIAIFASQFGIVDATIRKSLHRSAAG